MRISQRTMYQRHVSQMNNNLSAYMESNMQNASQKRVNRPSDDPAGMAHILQYRNNISESSQFLRNVDTAQGWLAEADAKLGLVDVTITRMLTLAEQGANGILTDKQRKDIGIELRALMGELINLSNSRFDNRSIFAGQHYNDSAFVESLTVDCPDTDFQNSLTAALALTPPQWPNITGPMERTTMVRFPGATTVIPSAADTDYEYSTDGGTTWVSATLAAGSNVIQMGGPTMTLPAGTTVPGFNPDDDRTTTLVIRPTAMYQGADNRAPATVSVHGPSGLAPVATGTFPTDIRVRFDQAMDVPPTADFTYSYSLDDGRTWTQGAGQAGDTRLAVPGGFLDLQPAGPGMIAQDDYVIIQPQRTSLDYQSNYDFLATVNNVGKDVFGGQFLTRNAQGETILSTAFGGDDRNLFEMAGKLIAALEVNSQQMVGEAVENLRNSLKTVTSYQSYVGGRYNALDVTKEMLESTKDNQSDRMSSVENVDLTELLTRLAQQELAYSSVLKSSSMIMQLNLMKFV